MFQLLYSPTFCNCLFIHTKLLEIFHQTFYSIHRAYSTFHAQRIFHIRNYELTNPLTLKKYFKNRSFISNDKKAIRTEIANILYNSLNKDSSFHFYIFSRPKLFLHSCLLLHMTHLETSFQKQ